MAVSIAVCNLVIVTFILYRFINGYGQIREQVSLLRSRSFGEGSHSGGRDDGMDLDDAGSADTPMTFTSIYTESEAPNLSRDEFDTDAAKEDLDPSPSSSREPLQKKSAGPALDGGV